MGAVALLVEGLTAKQAAFRLGISWPCYYRRLELARKRLDCATNKELLSRLGLAHEVEEEA
jgi:predicted DNA-binding protein (UPF0251 family)